MRYKIPFIRPQLPKSEEVAADYDAIQQSNWYTNFGPFEQRFREGINLYIGSDMSVVTVSSATSGLILAIKNIFEFPSVQRKKVIMPSFTFVAGASSLALLGYEPVFVDLNKKTLQPDHITADNYLENADNLSRVSGVLLCNTFGVGNPDIDRWESLCEKYNLPLIIDSAAGFGSLYADGTRVGSKGDCEVFSFHATKPFAIGEGGAVLCSNEKLASKIRQDTNFGFNERNEAVSLGINAKLSELSAAIGVRQLEAIDGRLQGRQNVLAMYKEALQPLGFKFQPNDERSSVAFVSCIADSSALFAALEHQLDANGIQYRNYYNPPIHRNGPFIDCEMISDLSVTQGVCDNIISLPAHGGATQEVINSLVERL